MSLDLGQIFGIVDIDDSPFNAKYTALVARFGSLGTSAGGASEGTTKLDASMVRAGVSATDLAAASRAAAVSIGDLDKTTLASASSTSDAAVASSKLTQAQLRQVAAAERLSALQGKETATTAQLAAAQAGLIAASDRVAVANEKVEASQRLGAKSADAMSTAWGKVPTPVKAGAAALLVAAAASVKGAIDYQKLTVNLVTGAGESQKNLSLVSSGMLHMAGQVGDSASSLAKAMFTVESAGYHGAAALTVLKIAAQGAKVDNADLATVVDTLTSSLNAYHLPASQAAVVTNTLIASAAVGKMHLQDLSAALGTVLPSAAALGVPLAQVGAAMATMTMQGTDSARAATYLRFAFAALANPTDKAASAMEMVGLSSTRVANTLQHGGLPAVLTMMEQAVGEKFPAGSAKYVAALANMVGGTRGLQAVLELTGTHLGTMESNLASIDNRVKQAGNSVSDWGEVQHNLNVQWSKFIDGLQAAGISIGTDLLPYASDLLKVLVHIDDAGADVVHFFENNKVAADALGAVLAGLLIPELIETGVWLERLIVMNAAAIFISLRAAVAEAAAAFLEADGAVEGFSAAMASLDINPVVLAVAALTAAGFALDHWLSAGVKTAFASGVTSAQAFIGSLHETHTSVQQTVADTAALNSQLNTVRATQSLNSSKTIGEVVTLMNARNASVAATKAVMDNEKGLSAQFGMSASQVEVLAKANGIDLSQSYGKVMAAMQEVISPTQALASDNKTLTTAVAGSANAVAALTNKLNILIGGPLAEHAAALQFSTDIDALTKAAKKNSGVISDNTAAGHKNAAMLQGLAGDIQTSIGNWEKAGVSTEKMSPKLRTLETRLIAAADATTGNSASVHKYLASMNLLPSQINKVLDSTGKLPGASAAAAAGVQKMSGQIARNAKQAADQAGNALKGSVPQATTAGLEFSDGYAGGIAAGLNAVVNAAAAIAAAAVAAARSPKGQDSGSPSRKMRAVGVEAGQGYVVGMDSMLPDVMRAGARLGSAAVLAAQQASAQVMRSIHAAVAPAFAVPSTAAAMLAALQQPAAVFGRDIPTAVGNVGAANKAKGTYQGLKANSRNADEFAKALAGVAKQADNAAAKAKKRADAMPDSTAAEKAAKDQAEAHAHALQLVADGDDRSAKAAARAATIADNNTARALRNYQKLESAAQAATSKVDAAATQLISDVAASVQTLSDQVTSYESTVSQGIESGSDLATMWGNVTTAAQNYASTIATLNGQILGDVDLGDLWVAATTAQTTAASDLATAQTDVASAIASQDPAALATATTELAKAQAESAAAGSTQADALNDVLAAFENQLTAAASFSTDLSTLTSEGLASGLVAQITAQGSSIGDALAQAIIAGGPSVIATLNQLGLQAGQTFAGAAGGAGPNPPSLQDQFNATLASTTQFAGDLNQLVTEGAGADLVSQVAAMGTTAGDALAQQLLAAGPAGITALQTSMDQISTIANTAATQLASQFYGSGVNAMEQFIEGLMDQYPALDAALAPLLLTLEGLGLTSSGPHLPGYSGPGGVTPDPSALPGFANGVTNFKGGAAIVGEAGPEIVTLPHGANVIPNAAISTAMQAMAALNDSKHKKHHDRNVPLFTGEGPKFYDRAYRHNEPFAVKGPAQWGWPYQTGLTDHEAREFEKWVAKNNVPFDPDARRVDYDMRGYWKHTKGKGWKPGDHFPDTWKTPYDTTFSDESKYATDSNPFKWHGQRLIDSRNGQLIFGPPRAGGPDAHFASIPGFAKGTMSAPGGLAWVGEQGPELVNLPRGAQVIPRGGDGSSLGFDIAPLVDRLERIERAILVEGPNAVGDAVGATVGTPIASAVTKVGVDRKRALRTGR